MGKFCKVGRRNKSKLYSGFRYPALIIAHIVWLCFWLALSFRDMEELMASRGIFVTYDTIPSMDVEVRAGPCQ